MTWKWDLSQEKKKRILFLIYILDSPLTELIKFSMPKTIDQETGISKRMTRGILEKQEGIIWMTKIIAPPCYAHNSLLTNDMMVQFKEEETEMMTLEDLQDGKTGTEMTMILLMIEILAQINISGTLNLLEEE